MGERRSSVRFRVLAAVVTIVLIVGALLVAGIAVTRSGPGGIVHIHNGGEAPLSGVRVTSGTWSLDVPAIYASDTFDVEVPRGHGPTWKVESGICSGSSEWGTLRPFGGEVHVWIDATSIFFGDQAAVDLVRAELRERLLNPDRALTPR